ncbi:NAD(P)-dependent alcohol dehydrogenase [Plantactinospora sp. WMMC1484]|uniref:NAD(P)-dependent alcohol dehydrogenase n=1 Tax=Plantactinospora sp. WMMC1484 TaxID=3404122 RepID=UPI003BF59CF5
MKAIVQDRYGSADSLRLAEVARPVAADDQVLVRIHAAAVNAYDWHAMRGDPYIARLSFGLGAGPRARIRGRDFAGRVAAVGRNVTRLRVGDTVYGDLGPSDGAFAEYACVREELVEAMPANLTFAQAAAMPVAGSTALICLRDAAQLQPGQHVLVNGASGGVGSFAVQLAKAFGARVTGVCSTRNLELVSTLGADEVVDYTRDDFTRDDFVRAGGRYDVVLDLVGNRSLADCRRALTADGTLVLSGGGVSGSGSLLGPVSLLSRGRLLARFVRQRLVVPSTTPGRENLVALRQLAEAGKVVPVIDRSYPLEKAPEAIRYVEVEHARAKVVITG